MPAERRLRAVSTPVDTDLLSPAERKEATRRAWGIVAESFNEALAIRGISDEDAATFVRCHRNACSLARVPIAQAVPGDSGAA